MLGFGVSGGVSGVDSGGREGGDSADVLDDEGLWGEGVGEESRE